MSAPRQHGHTIGYQRTPTYESWSAMMGRCRPGSPSARRHGDRGITVCDRWKAFENFLADMGERPSGKYSIERLDNEKGYEPSNCRWANYKEQARNRSSNKFLTHQGKTMAIAAWADEIGLSADALSKRIRAGWSAEKALTAPRRSYPQRQRRA